MSDYLNGYLDVLPRVESDQVQNTVQSSISSASKNITIDEYQEVVRRLSEDHSLATTVIDQKEKMDPELYNALFGSAYSDLVYMFMAAELIDSATGSYERLFDGVVADMQKEVIALQDRIGMLKLVANGENGLIVKQVKFEDTSMMETDRQKYEHLFADRDGSQVRDVAFLKNGGKGYIALTVTDEADAVHSLTGSTTAQIKVIDQRGTPIPQTLYPISNAFDKSTETYWGEVVLTQGPINVGMPMDDDTGKTFEPGGAYVKIQVDFPRQMKVSEVKLLPYATRPLEIVSIVNEQDVETHHTKDQLLPAGKTFSGTGWITAEFPSVLSRRLTIVLRQKNYVEDHYQIRATQSEKTDLWEKISKREMEVTLNPSYGTNTVTQTELDNWDGWNIYLDALKQYQGEWVKYIESVKRYKAQYDKYVQDIQSYNRSYGRGAKPVNPVVSIDKIINDPTGLNQG